MVTISNKAAVKLKEQLINKCFKVGIGFRMLVNTGESGKPTLSIKLDRECSEDEVIESKGVKLFFDPASIPQIRGYQLDYQDEPGGGFLLSTMQEVKDG